MQSVPREWLDFLRQQFPKDSRIQLTEIAPLVEAAQTQFLDISFLM